MSQRNKLLSAMTNKLWVALMQLCIEALGKLSKGVGAALLNFWAYRGGGKTTFLHQVALKLSSQNVGILGPWDMTSANIESLIPEILQAVTDAIQAKKVVLLDNLDALLRYDAGRFFDFEQQLIVQLLQRGDVLLIATSQIRITQWREYDVRIRQENHQIPALSIDDVRQISKSPTLDSEQLYTLSLGYPQVLAWLLEDPDLPEINLAHKIMGYFLADLPTDVYELALVSSLLPTFDIAVLRDILPTGDTPDEEGLYADYIERIRELISSGLIIWDMQMGAYRFANPVVRRLVARSYQLAYPDAFIEIHKGAAAYYESESRRAGYLHYVFVNTLYHLAQVQYSADPKMVGDCCRSWVQDNLSLWLGANWNAVVDTWQQGGKDEMVREELRKLLGTDVVYDITKLLESAKNATEVLQ